MSHNRHSFGTHARAEAPYSEVMESTRPTWNDQRMDEFADRTEENFREVRREVRDEVHGLRTELRGEIRGVRSELKGDIRDLRGEMNERFANLERRFDIMIGAMATGFVGLIISHFIG
jgi:hypothetical protein